MCSLVVAASTNDVIGDEGAIPWRLRSEQRAFRRRTLGHVLVAGRATQDSIVAAIGHGLSDRTTLVLSRDPSYPDAVGSFDEARRRAEELSRSRGLDEWFVIGGVAVYVAALPIADRVYLTRVHAEVPGDTAMPAGWLDDFERRDASEPQHEGGFEYTIETWDRP